MHFLVPIIGRVTPAKIGEAKKIFNENLNTEEAGMAHIIERFVDIILLMIFSLLNLNILLEKSERYIFVFILIFFILVFISLLIFHEKFLKSTQKLISKIKRKFKTEKSNELNNDHNDFQKIKFKQFSYIIFWSLIIWLLSFSTHYFLSKSVGMNLNFFRLSSIVALTIIISTLSGIPGGFGIRELSLNLLLGIFIVDSLIILSYTILVTIFLVSSELLISLIGILMKKFIEKKKVLAN
jgi:uncharacterized protein (TIRG00374 family)